MGVRNVRVSVKMGGVGEKRVAGRGGEEVAFIDVFENDRPAFLNMTDPGDEDCLFDETP